MAVNLVTAYYEATTLWLDSSYYLPAYYLITSDFFSDCSTYWLAVLSTMQSINLKKSYSILLPILADIS
jgi:hypothetical protein